MFTRRLGPSFHWTMVMAPKTMASIWKRHGGCHQPHFFYFFFFLSFSENVRRHYAVSIQQRPVTGQWALRAGSAMTRIMREGVHALGYHFVQNPITQQIKSVVHSSWPVHIQVYPCKRHIDHVRCDEWGRGKSEACCCVWMLKWRRHIPTRHFLEKPDCSFISCMSNIGPP